jgi:hypothetical protein
MRYKLISSTNKKHFTATSIGEKTIEDLIERLLIIEGKKSLTAYPEAKISE